ncbi:MAG: hypothetical protein GEU99_24155 [Luteitalea sp.]|nr:hypothetical protein [Luteitalea sp.]
MTRQEWRLDFLTFTAQIVSALAWPITLVVCAALLRRPLASLVPLIRTLKYSDIEVQFGRELAELKTSAAAVATQKADVQTTPRRAVWEDLVRLASVRPRTAIREAWQHVEAGLVRLAKDRKLDAAPGVWSMPMVLGALMLNSGMLAEHQYDLLSRLRRLASEAERAPVDGLNPEDAVDFVGLALRFAASLEADA